MKTSIKTISVVTSLCITRCNAFTSLPNVKQKHDVLKLDKFNSNPFITPNNPTQIQNNPLLYAETSPQNDNDPSTKTNNPPFLQTIQSLLPNITIALLSFITGIFLTIITIFGPILSSVSSSEFSKPVALFETILTDLDRGYVEEVNTKKLFETGISAMLRSLDPYTEYLEPDDDLLESMVGRYGGVGIVIQRESVEDSDDADAAAASSSLNGIIVADAYEGYAFDCGMRVGDKLLQVDSTPVSAKSVEEVRSMLRGEPGTDVKLTFERDGEEGEREVTIPRRIVKVRDVKCATLLDENVGYVQLSSFGPDAGREMREAVLDLQERMREMDGEGMKGLILDLRNNPGGLLNSAVEVASLFVPKDSDIVSARGRTFPSLLYKSNIDPILQPSTKLVVLTNSGTASAAEVVSGAIQDLDAGVILGGGRTYGKGLVQNVRELPYENALKITVAKYYTPSGRCIQSTNYIEGGGLDERQAGYISEKIKHRDIFYTLNGREVKDGGGIEPDYKVTEPKASLLEMTLLRSGAFQNFASEYVKHHHSIQEDDTLEVVSEEMYREFIQFCLQKQKSKELQLEAIYKPSLNQLHQVLKQSGYEKTEHELDVLQANLMRDIQSDFMKYKKDIKEDIGQNILARYMPQSLLSERAARNDVQVKEAINLIQNDGTFDRLLARDGGNGVGLTKKGEELASKSGSLTTASSKI